MAEAYIVEAVRTAGGKRAGRLAGWHPVDLGAEVLNAVVERSGLDPAGVDDVIMGCVMQAGEQAFAFGRNAVLSSRLANSTPAVTIDRQCGSSQQAVSFAAQAVMSGVQDVVIAAGSESMTRVPMFSNFTLHEKAGIGEGPLSAKLKAEWGVQNFSQFLGAEMLAKKHGLGPRHPGSLRPGKPPSRHRGHRGGRLRQGDRGTDGGHARRAAGPPPGRRHPL